MKTMLLAAGLLTLFLTGCASLTKAPPSTDLQVLRLGVQALTEPTRVEGAIQSRADARTNGDLWLLAGRQADAIDKANDDKARLRQFIQEATEAIENGREPCRWWQVGCRLSRH